MSWGTPLAEQGMTDAMYVTFTHLAPTTPYWKASFNFVEQIADRHFTTLSEAQQDWAYEIIAIVRVETDRRIAKDVWEGHPVGNLQTAIESLRTKKFNVKKVD